MAMLSQGYDDTSIPLRPLYTGFPSHGVLTQEKQNTRGRVLASHIRVHIHPASVCVGSDWTNHDAWNYWEKKWEGHKIVLWVIPIPSLTEEDKTCSRHQEISRKRKTADVSCDATGPKMKECPRNQEGVERNTSLSLIRSSFPACTDGHSTHTKSTEVIQIMPASVTQRQ